jgi:hypothetical protein
MGRLGVDEGTRVVLYCRDHNVRAARVWWMLRAFGFDTAAVLNGGWVKWTQEGRPASVWRLQRLNRMEAGVIAWHRGAIIVERARREVQRYQRNALAELAEKMDPPTITNEEAHRAALASVREAVVQQEQDVATFELAFVKDAEGPDALSSCPATRPRSSGVSIGRCTNFSVCRPPTPARPSRRLSRWTSTSRRPSSEVGSFRKEPLVPARLSDLGWGRQQSLPCYLGWCPRPEFRRIASAGKRGFG